MTIGALVSKWMAVLFTRKTLKISRDERTLRKFPFPHLLNAYRLLGNH